MSLTAFLSSRVALVALLIFVSRSKKKFLTGSVVSCQPRPIFSLKSPHALESCTSTSAVAAATPLYCLATNSIARPFSSSSFVKSFIAPIWRPNNPALPFNVALSCCAALARSCPVTAAMSAAALIICMICSSLRPVAASWLITCRLTSSPISERLCNSLAKLRKL